MGRSRSQDKGESHVVHSSAGQGAVPHGPGGRVRWGLPSSWPRRLWGSSRSTGLRRRKAFADLDTRTSSIAPSQAQLDAVADLGAVARWTDFGTPESLIRHGGFLAEGIQAESAAEAARSFLDANRVLYRIDSTSGLKVGDGGAARRQRARRRLPADRGRPAGLAGGRGVGRARSLRRRLEGRLCLVDARRIGRACCLGRAHRAPRRLRRHSATRASRCRSSRCRERAPSTAGARWTSPACATISSSAGSPSRRRTAVCAWRSRPCTPTVSTPGTAMSSTPRPARSSTARARSSRSSTTRAGRSSRRSRR